MAVDNGAQVSVSARSMGDVNVQVIIGKAGGGGHLTMAGAPAAKCIAGRGKRRLLEAISEYRESQRTEKQKNS